MHSRGRIMSCIRALRITNRLGADSQSNKVTKQNYFIKPISDKGFLPLPAFGALDKISIFSILFP